MSVPAPCPQCQQEIPQDIPAKGEITYTCPGCDTQLTGPDLIAARTAANVDNAYEENAPEITTYGYTAVSMPAPHPGPLRDEDRDGVAEPQEVPAQAEAPKKAPRKKAAAKK